MSRLLAALITLMMFPAMAAGDSSVQRLPEQEALLLAFRATFQKPPPATIADKDNRDYDHHPEALLWRGETAVLLTMATSPQLDCHGCGGKLGVHYLTPVGDSFVVLGSWPHLVEFGFEGFAPNWKIRTDLASNPVIEFSAGSYWHGIKCSWTGLIELLPAQPLQILGPVLTSRGNSEHLTDGGFDATPDVSVEALIVPIVKDRIFLLRYTGAPAFDLPFERTGSTFAPSGTSQIPEC